MKAIGLVGVAVFAVACGGSESHNSSQSGATARAGIANPGNQPKVTLNGCLRNADNPDPADARPTGSTGSTAGRSAGGAADQMAAGRGSPGERYTLTHASSASGASDPAAASYVLDGNVEALRGHIDQQVRLTGTLDPAAANSAGPQRVRVESVEQTAERCSER
jgi:hypothetical protein